VVLRYPGPLLLPERDDLLQILLALAEAGGGLSGGCGTGLMGLAPVSIVPGFCRMVFSLVTVFRS